MQLKPNPTILRRLMASPTQTAHTPMHHTPMHHTPMHTPPPAAHTGTPASAAAAPAHAANTAHAANETHSAHTAQAPSGNGETCDRSPGTGATLYTSPGIHAASGRPVGIQRVWGHEAHEKYANESYEVGAVGELSVLSELRDFEGKVRVLSKLTELTETGWSPPNSRQHGVMLQSAESFSDYKSSTSSATSNQRPCSTSNQRPSSTDQCAPQGGTYTRDFLTHTDTRDILTHTDMRDTHPDNHTRRTTSCGREERQEERRELQDSRRESEDSRRESEESRRLSEVSRLESDKSLDALDKSLDGPALASANGIQCNDARVGPGYQGSQGRASHPSPSHRGSHSSGSHSSGSHSSGLALAASALRIPVILHNTPPPPHLEMQEAWGVSPPASWTERNHGRHRLSPRHFDKEVTKKSNEVSKNANVPLHHLAGGGGGSAETSRHKSHHDSRGDHLSELPSEAPEGNPEMHLGEGQSKVLTSGKEVLGSATKVLTSGKEVLTSNKELPSTDPGNTHTKTHSNTHSNAMSAHDRKKAFLSQFRTAGGAPGSFVMGGGTMAMLHTKAMQHRPAHPDGASLSNGFTPPPPVSKAVTSGALAASEHTSMGASHHSAAPRAHHLHHSSAHHAQHSSTHHSQHSSALASALKMSPYLSPELAVTSKVEKAAVDAAMCSLKQHPRARGRQEKGGTDSRQVHINETLNHRYASYMHTEAQE